jgi:hypothetical protein
MKQRSFLAAPALLPAVAQGQPQPPLIGILRVGSEKNELFVPTFKREIVLRLV